MVASRPLCISGDAVSAISLTSFRRRNGGDLSIIVYLISPPLITPDNGEIEQVHCNCKSFSDIFSQRKVAMWTCISYPSIRGWKLFEAIGWMAIHAMQNRVLINQKKKTTWLYYYYVDGLQVLINFHSGKLIPLTMPGLSFRAPTQNLVAAAATEESHSIDIDL